MHARAHVCVRVVRIGAYVSVRACVRACVRAYVHVPQSSNLFASCVLLGGGGG